MAGVYVDRVKRRWIMIACDLGSMFALGSIPAAYVEIAYQSYLPALIPNCRRWCDGAPVGPRPDFAPWHRR